MTRRARLWIEWTLLYVLSPGLLAIVSRAHRWVVLVAIVFGSILAFACLLGDATWPRSQLIGELRKEAAPALVRALSAVGLLLVLLATSGRWPSFQLVRERPLVWLGVLLYYPLLSAFPQEGLYRALFFHRYGGLFRRDTSRIAASALVFGWAHVLVHDRVAMVLAALAGALLSINWVRSRSLLLVGLEHTIYGACVLTTGVGGLFVNGIRLMSRLLG